jgi:UDP-N-acetylmuramoylalanine--D-glutamate ligase
MQYIHHLQNKKIGILGLARTGISSYLSLKNSGINVILWDDNYQIKKPSFSDLILEEDVYSPDSDKWHEIDLLIVSPGIPSNYPSCHELITLAKQRNIKYVCDIEILYNENKNADYIAITGTNGKSTTTSLIGHIFSSAKKINQVGGNIGIASLDLEKLQKNQSYILELSSFQLEILDEFKANIAILLNITPDHLDRYKNMADYIEAKCRIFRNQSANDIAIINIDNDLCKEIYSKLSKNNNCNLIPFSVKFELEYGAYIKNNQLFLNIDLLEQNKINKLKEVFDIPYNIALLGKHNQENIIAAVIAAYLRLIPKNIINDALKSFQGLPHRMEYIGTIKANYINDSKATNIDSSIPALRSFDNIIWIAGGYEKSKEDLSKIEPYLGKIKKALFIGQSAKDLYDYLNDKINCEICENLELAFNKANEIASNEDNILFSPGYASLDQFKNFEERGNSFRKLFQQAKKKSSL